ncbi:MAG: GTP-binding protein [Euryarchaeota archaeon]|nr:GTP-binding protein [Euryarchaeota archaeon]
MAVKRKVVLLGDSEVGKTSLVRRFVYNIFSDAYIQTIGTKVSKKNIKITYEDVEYEIMMVLWDVLGQQGYTNVQRAAFRGSDGAIFVCDLTRKETLHSILHYWLPTLESVAGVPGVLMANKRDLSEWEIDVPDLEEFSKITGLPYMLTSAKTGENVEESFYMLGELMLLYRPVRSLEKDTKKIESAKDALDVIMEDFCKNYGNWNDGMAVVEANIRVIGIDMKKPKIPQLHILVDKLYRIEAYNLGLERAQKNKVKRLGIINRIKK